MAKPSLAEHPADAELAEQTQFRADAPAVSDQSRHRASAKPTPEQEADVAARTHADPRTTDGSGSTAPPASSRETLLDFFDDAFTSAADFLIHDTGYRSWTYSYEQVRGAALRFAARLRDKGIRKGDKIIIWSENRAEWVVVRGDVCWKA